MKTNPRTLSALALALAAMLLYLPSVRDAFVVIDDPQYVGDNPTVLKGLTREGIAWAFRSTLSSNWHPLTWISHMVDVELFGTSPGGHHFVNVMLHSLNAGLHLLLLSAMTGSLAPSAAVATLFAIHPLHVESVAWVAERKDLLSSLFLLLAASSYLRYVRRPSVRRYATVLLLFAIGLTAKPMIVTFPFLLLLLDFWPLGRHRAVSPARLVIEKAPHFLLSALSSVVTLGAQKASIAPAELLPVAPRLQNALVAVVSYLARTVWPARLAVLYPYPLDGVPTWRWVVAGVILAVITLLAVASLRRFPFLPVGWFWFIGMLVPVSGIVQVGTQAMADRYTYLPLTGLFIALVWGARVAVERRPRLARLVAVVGAIVAVACWFTTARQLSRWRNSETLLSHSLAVTNGNWFVHHAAALVLMEEGRNGEAELHLRETVMMRPDEPEFLSDLALALDRQGKREEAEKYYREALRQSPHSADIMMDLGALLRKEGRLKEALPLLEGAVGPLAGALKGEVDLPGVHNDLGLALKASGKMNEAIEQFREALRLDPSLTPALVNLGMSLAARGDHAEAAVYLRKAVDSSPASANLHYNLATALDALGDEEGALKEYLEVLKLDPTVAEAHNSLGIILANRGQLEGAAAAFREALRLKPDFAAARMNLHQLDGRNRP